MSLESRELLREAWRHTCTSHGGVTVFTRESMQMRKRSVPRPSTGLSCIKGREEKQYLARSLKQQAVRRRHQRERDEEVREWPLGSIAARKSDKLSTTYEVESRV